MSKEMRDHSGRPVVAVTGLGVVSSLGVGLNDNSAYEQFMYGNVGEKLADSLGTKGAPISLTTACASGATAIQLGVESIRRGDADAAICIGTDCSVTAESVIRFVLLSALSNANEVPEEAAKPFSKDRDG